MVHQTTHKEDVLLDLARAIEDQDMQQLFTTIQVHMAREKLVIPFEFLQSFVQKEALSLPKKRSIWLRSLYVSASNSLGIFRLDFDGITSIAPCSQINSLIQSAS